MTRGGCDRSVCDRSLPRLFTDHSLTSCVLLSIQPELSENDSQPETMVVKISEDQQYGKSRGINELGPPAIQAIKRFLYGVKSFHTCIQRTLPRIVARIFAFGQGLLLWLLIRQSFVH